MGLPLASIAALLFLGQSQGIAALALGTVVGFVLHLGVLSYGLRRQKLAVWPRWHGMTPSLRRVLRLYLPTMGGAALLSSTTLVDQAMATLLAPGSVATLTYGNRIVAFVLSVLSQALAIAVLPYFAEMVTARDWRGLRHSLRSYAGLLGVASVALTALGVVCSPLLVQLLFQRGEFTAADTRLVSQVQQMYLLQIPFVTLGVLFARLLSALQANRYLLWGNAISFVVNITLDYLLIQVMGIAGIALSTALVFLGSCIYLAVTATRVLKHAEATTVG
jgi:putative peptidoglycan lipid II flippase